MLTISEEQLNKTIHDILKVVGCLKEMATECGVCDRTIRLLRYAKVLISIREEMLTSVTETGETNQEA